MIKNVNLKRLAQLPERCLRARQWLLLVLLTGGYCMPGWSVPSIAAPPSGLMLKPTDQGLWIDGLKALAIGTLGLSAAAGVLFWLRRHYAAATKTNHSMQLPILKSSRRISQKTLLLVVEWEDKTYLLAESNNATQVVDSRAAASAQP